MIAHIFLYSLWLMHGTFGFIGIKEMYRNKDGILFPVVFYTLVNLGYYTIHLAL